MQPRQAHYQLAHGILVQDAQRPQGDIWPVISGADGPAYFAMKWHTAGGDPELASQLRIVMNQPMAGYHVIVVSMPTPAAPTEAYFVAYARSGVGVPLRYFVMERGVQDVGSPERAYVAEYRADGMRIQHGRLPAVSIEAFTGHLMQELTVAPASVPAISTPPFSVPPASATVMAAPLRPSVPPMTVPPMTVPPSRVRPNKSGLAKWIALGVVGLVGVVGAGVVAYMTWDYARVQAHQARSDARDAAAAQAAKGNRTARKDARQRLIELERDHRSCLDTERSAAKNTLALARSSRTFSGRNKRPGDSVLGALKSAVVYEVPTDAAPATLAFDGTGGTDWIPVSPWMSRTGTACDPLPTAYHDLDKSLQTRKPGKYRYDKKRRSDENTEAIEELVAALAGKGSQSAPASSVLAVVGRSCKETAVTHYHGAPGNPHNRRGLNLLRYSCKATVTWVAKDGSLLARLTAKGSARPGTRPRNTTTSELLQTNRATLAKAHKSSSDQLQKAMNAWVGGAD